MPLSREADTRRWAGACEHLVGAQNASALKHGIDAEDAIHAAIWATLIDFLDDDSPARRLRPGFDSRGRMPETVVLVFDHVNEFVIHAMKAQPQMLDLLL